MPELIPLVIGAFKGFSFSTFFVGLAVSSAISFIGQKLFARSQTGPQSFTQEARNRQIVVRSAVQSRRVIYGRTVTSGPLFFLATNDDDLHMLVALTHGRVAEVEYSLLNDTDSNNSKFGVLNKHIVRAIPGGLNSNSFLKVDDLNFPGATAQAIYASYLATDQNLLHFSMVYTSPPFPGVQPGFSITANQAGQELTVTTGGTWNVYDVQSNVSNNTATLRSHLGDINQEADSLLVDSFDEWTDEHRARGISYIYAKLKNDVDVFPNGIPNIKSIIRGRELYDPRLPKKQIYYTGENNRADGMTLSGFTLNNATRVLAAATAMDGTNNATKITIGTGSVQHGISYTAGVVADEIRDYEFYLKIGALDVAKGVSVSIGTNGQFVIDKKGRLAVVADGLFAGDVKVQGVSYQDIDWIKIGFSAEYTAAAMHTISISFNASADSYDVSVEGNSTDNFYVWGFSDKDRNESDKSTINIPLHGFSIADHIFVRDTVGAGELFGAHYVSEVIDENNIKLIDLKAPNTPLVLSETYIGGQASKMLWSDNYAICLADYLMLPQGFGAGQDEMNFDDVITAANIADEQVPLVAATESFITKTKGDGYIMELTGSKIDARTGDIMSINTETAASTLQDKALKCVVDTTIGAHLLESESIDFVEDDIFHIEFYFQGHSSNYFFPQIAISSGANYGRYFDAEGTAVGSGILFTMTLTEHTDSDGSEWIKFAADFDFTDEASASFIFKLYFTGTHNVDTSYQGFAGNGTDYFYFSEPTATLESVVVETISMLDDYTSTNSVITLPASLLIPGGLAGNTDYYFINRGLQNNREFFLAETLDKARAVDPVDVTSLGSGVLLHKSQPRYTVNGSVEFSSTPASIIQSMISSGAGDFVYSSNFRIYAGASTGSVMSLDESSLRGEISVIPAPPLREKFSGVRGNFTDPNKYYQPTSFAPIKNDIYADEDGGLIYESVDFGYTDHEVRAQRAAKIFLEKSRQGITINAPCNFTPLSLTVGDVIDYSIKELGWDRKQFRVLKWTFAEGGGIDLTLVEESPASYDWNLGDQTLIDAAPDTTLQSPFDKPAPVAGFSVTSEDSDTLTHPDGTQTHRALAKWDAIENIYVTNGGKIYLSYKLSASNIWGESLPDPAATEYYLNVINNSVYDFRIRVETSGRVKSDYVFFLSLVVGLANPPSDVASLTVTQTGSVVTFTWPPVADPSLSGYTLKYASANGFDWTSATNIDSDFSGTEFSTVSILPGSWRFAIKAIDTAGIESENEATFDFTVTAAYQDLYRHSEQPGWFIPGVTLHGFIRHWRDRLVPESADTDALADDIFDVAVPRMLPQLNSEGSVNYAYYGDAVNLDAVLAVRIYSLISSAPMPGETDDSWATLRTLVGGVSAYRVGNPRYATTDSVAFALWLLDQASFLNTDSPPAAYISEMVNVVDIAERIEVENNVTISATGTDILFTSEFMNLPIVKLFLASSGALIPSFDNLTTSGFTAHVYNTSDVEVGGVIDWEAAGV